MKQIFVDSEVGFLEEVVIGFPDNFHLIIPEVINESQRKYYNTDHSPTPKTLIPEFDDFEKALRSCGVKVLRVDEVKTVPDQLTPRDIAFAVGGVLVLAGMAKNSRKQELLGIQSLIELLPEDKILRVPAGIVLEGGDVVVDRGKIFVGLSQRTTVSGVEFLRNSFPDWEVVPVPLRALSDGEDVLHLDCAFVPIGLSQALVYMPGIANLPLEIQESYELVEVTAEEQRSLFINVLSVSPDTIISRQKATRLNEILRRKGFQVHEVQFEEAPKTGGSFRCCSLPLRRRPL